MAMKQKPKNNVELNKMRAAGRLAAEVLDFITPYVKEGENTLKLNDLCHDFIIQHGATPAPLNYRGFPKSICTSINDVVCHGIPSKDDVLKDGDILNIDVTVILDGFHGDTSRMFLIGNVSKEHQQLVQNTYEAMMVGINTVKSGGDIQNIGCAIEEFIKPKGYGIVEEYCGHGIGKTFHSDPMVVHYANNHPNYSMKLRKGHTFTVEPMINMGTAGNELMDDEWTVRTLDRKFSAQFEHTVAVTENGVEILTESPAGLHYPPYNL
ncbi:MAG: type I methionyl aminopeptidase [Magnetococcales bacterium]|nr:type I methionyl aminopeptidase [Magnetococcales bacterium]|tara:strand:- start:75883 stop:76680 length:798 start_codon:yes stop_codon:yes gene_type:complete